MAKTNIIQLKAEAMGKIMAAHGQGVSKTVYEADATEAIKELLATETDHVGGATLACNFIDEVKAAIISMIPPNTPKEARKRELNKVVTAKRLCQRAVKAQFDYAVTISTHKSKPTSWAAKAERSRAEKVEAFLLKAYDGLTEADAGTIVAGLEAGQLQLEKEQEKALKLAQKNAAQAREKYLLPEVNRMAETVVSLAEARKVERTLIADLMVSTGQVSQEVFDLWLTHHAAETTEQAANA